MKKPHTYEARTSTTIIALVIGGKRSFLHVTIKPGVGNSAAIDALGYVSGEAKLRKLALAILEELGPAKKRARKAGG